MKIIHVINSLEIGGAEMMLLKLLNSGIYSNDEILILVLTKNTVLTEKIRKLGFNVEHFNFSKNFYIFREAIKFYKRIKIFSPDIVQSWLYFPDLIIAPFAKLVGAKIIWGIFLSELQKSYYKRSTWIAIRLCGRIEPLAVWNVMWMPQQHPPTPNMNRPGPSPMRPGYRPSDR